MGAIAPLYPNLWCTKCRQYASIEPWEPCPCLHSAQVLDSIERELLRSPVRDLLATTAKAFARVNRLPTAPHRQVVLDLSDAMANLGRRDSS